MQKRVFYVDVNMLSTDKAQKYVEDFKQRVMNADVETDGEVKDYFIPTNDGHGSRVKFESDGEYEARKASLGLAVQFLGALEYDDVYSTDKLADEAVSVAAKFETYLRG